ncbi:MAG: hypothetical protein LBK52_00385 [Deltaproteobacteria bacterium]|jgi:hypothetical protein|nr:hypothetical protein [Deltaproteobacteria bacterium]
MKSLLFILLIFVLSSSQLSLAQTKRALNELKEEEQISTCGSAGSNLYRRVIYKLYRKGKLSAVITSPANTLVNTKTGAPASYNSKHTCNHYTEKYMDKYMSQCERGSDYLLICDTKEECIEKSKQTCRSR